MATDSTDRPTFIVGDESSPFDQSDIEENSNFEPISVHLTISEDNAQQQIGAEEGSSSNKEDESPPSQSDSREEGDNSSISGLKIHILLIS